MKYFLIRCSAGICLLVSAAAFTRSEVSVPMNVIAEPNVMTDRMGGVDVPSADVLKEMHEGQYVLRAAGGKLTKLPVEKVVLPHSDDMSPQSAQVDLGPDGVVYVRESHILCKSIDGGRTWTSQPLLAQVRPTFVRLLGKRGTSTVPHTHVGCIARFGEQLRLSRSGGFHLSRLQSNGTRVGLSNLRELILKLIALGVRHEWH